MADVSMSMLSESRIAGDGGGNAQRLLAEDHARRLDGIAADIEQPAAAVLADVADVVGVEFEVAERAHRANAVARCARRAPVPQSARHCGWFCTMKPSPILTPVRSRTAISSSASCGVQADRLFAEHVLACLGGAHGPRHVQVIGQRIVDRVDLRIGQHLLVGAVGFGNAEFARRRFGPRRVARRDARDLAALARPAWPE